MTDTALHTAIRHHQSGDLRQAEAGYRQLLASNPRQPDALHLLGVLARQCGRASEAVQLIERALELAPQQPVLYYNLGQSLVSADRHAEAICAYRRAVELKPDFVEAWKNLGVALERAAQLDAALTCYERNYMLRPASAEAACDLANMLTKLGRFDPALETARRSVALDPTLGRAGNQLGLSLLATAQSAEAEAAWRECLQRNRDYVPVLSNLGRLLHDQERFAEAIEHFERALAIEPDSYELLVNMGAALKDHAEYDRAMTVLTRAAQLAPARHEGWLNLGKVHEELGELRLALSFFDRALALSPGNPEIRLNRALVLLQLGDYQQGWTEYESRWRTSDAPARPTLPLVEWCGEPLTGRRFLVCGEQGVGDEIMFASCLPDLMQCGAEVTLTAEARLTPLLERSFPRARVVSTPKSAEQWHVACAGCVYQITAGSLPRYFRAKESDFPQVDRYLIADEQRIAKWRERYRALGSRPTIGVSWRAGTTPKTRRHRSAPIAEWRPLANVNAQFVNLQYGATAAELATFREAGLDVHTWPDVDPLRDLDDFAAQLAALDLVVSVGNATVHLAGALGVPCWVLLPCSWGWRWGVDRTDSPWYRSLHLFRQQRSGGWSVLISRVADTLETALTNSDGRNTTQLAPLG